MIFFKKLLKINSQKYTEAFALLYFCLIIFSILISCNLEAQIKSKVWYDGNARVLYYRDALQGKNLDLNDKVNFLGFKNFEDRNEFIKDCDLFFVPSNRFLLFHICSPHVSRTDPWPRKNALKVSTGH